MIKRSAVQLAGLFALALAVGGGREAQAQNVGPLPLTFVFRDGAMFNYINGTGWKGIGNDKIDAGYNWSEKYPELFTRAKVRVVCAARCPDDLYRYGDSDKDKVVWKEGPPSFGRIEVRCGDYHRCSVFQDGKPVHPQARDGDWHLVRYLELAPPGKN